MHSRKFNLVNVWSFTALIFVISIGLLATLPMAFAALAYFLLVAGLVQRKNRKKHVPLMLSGIVIDLGIVLSLEIQRNAIRTALEFSLSLLQQLHILFSALATVLYFPMVGIGIIMLKIPNSNSSLRKTHRVLGWITFLFRSLGFLLMFSLLMENH